MKTAFAYWDNRIAPVFDSARKLHVVETESGRIVSERQETLTENLPVQRALRLVELGVGVVVCGAISRSMHGLLSAYGLEVVPFVAGDLQDVIRAWLVGTLGHLAYSMPGCCGRNRHRNTLTTSKENREMNRQGQGGKGKGGGQGQGRTGHGRGRMGGPAAAGAAGTCRCPNCGHSEPHERGMPCVQKQCPKCGTAMTRE